MSKQVLLTGVGGFIGHHIAERILAKTDWTIVGVDSWNPKHRGDKLRISEPLMRAIEEDRMRVIEVDLADAPSDQMLRKIRSVCFAPEYIVNLASDSHVTRSITDPRSCWENNTRLIMTMLEVAQYIGCEKFLHISTDEVYGDAGWDGPAHSEWAPIVPSNPYSASKAAQEALAIAYWRTYELPVCIANTMNVIGERQHPEKFLPLVISRILHGEEIEIHADAEDKIASRRWLDAQNMAAAVIHLLYNVPFDQYCDGRGADRPSRYNIVGDVEMNVFDLAMKVGEILGMPCHTRLVRGDDARPGYDRRYALDGSKLRGTRFEPPIAFGDSLSRIVRWTKDNPLWREKMT